MFIILLKKHIVQTSSLVDLRLVKIAALTHANQRLFQTLVSCFRAAQTEDSVKASIVHNSLHDPTSSITALEGQWLVDQVNGQSHQAQLIKK